MLLNGKAPKAGDIMKMPHLANTFKVCGMSGSRRVAIKDLWKKKITLHVQLKILFKNAELLEDCH